MSKFVLKEKKTLLQKEVSTLKSFSYKKNDVNLSFQLVIDDGGKQLKNFKECLTQALDDITELLEG